MFIYLTIIAAMNVCSNAMSDETGYDSLGESSALASLVSEAADYLAR